MSTKVKARKTSEERRAEAEAEAEALPERITAQVQELTSGEGWAQFLRVSTGFHHYSFGNVLLILSQRPDATGVAGFRQWQQRGRQVRKGNGVSASSATRPSASSPTRTTLRRRSGR